MDYFDSWRDYWTFSHTVKRDTRYVFNSFVEKFLTTVVATANSRKATIEKDGLLWRAQLGCESIEKYDSYHEFPFSEDRMKPQAELVGAGRVNPKGIAYFYLSDDQDTAMAELRPWKKEQISLARFRVQKELTVVDCSNDVTRTPICLKEPEPQRREDIIWTYINKGFAEPVSAQNQAVDYVPTQIIAEAFKQAGYDGIVYKSSLGEGRNFALFNLDSVKMVRSQSTIFTLNHIEFDFQRSG